MTIRTQPPPVLAGNPKASFLAEAFDAAVWQQGYTVLLEEARQCPCRSHDSGSALATCTNCRGFGFNFLNPIITRGIVSNINKKGKYFEWSEENVGTIMISLLNVNKLSEMDRLTFTEIVSKRSEALRVRIVDGQMFVFTVYKPIEILDIFYFESPATPLVKLDTSDYVISDENPYVILLNFVPPDAFNNTVTVTYTCAPTYHVLDILHDARAGTITDHRGQLDMVNLPINAIFRKSHLMLGMNDYDNSGVQTIDNSYK